MERWISVPRRIVAIALIIGLLAGVGGAGLAAADGGADASVHAALQEEPEPTPTETPQTETETTQETEQPTETETTEPAETPTETEASAEFVDCSTVRVTGDVERVMVESSYYMFDGVAGNTYEYGPVDGEQVIELDSGDGLNGESLDSVAGYAADGTQLFDADNPDREECWNQIRPERVDVSVVGSERVDDDTQATTFAYANPTDETLRMSSEFDGDAEDEPPREFRPGTHEFTVEWESDERDALAWEVGLSAFGYENAEVSATAMQETESDDADDEDDSNEDESDEETTEASTTMTIQDDDQNDQNSASAEFVDCSTVRVTGEVERVMVESSYYMFDGVAGNTYEYGPVDGEETISLDSGDGLNGESLDSVTGYAADGTQLFDADNPDREECWTDIRPERPELSFVEATETAEGTYEVTFSYTNPTDETLVVRSSFEGEVSAEPPSELEPGTNEFTVEWTPEGEDDELVWSVGLNAFGYDKEASATATVSAETEAETDDDDDDGGVSGESDGDETEESDDETEESDDETADGSDGVGGADDADAADEPTETERTAADTETDEPTRTGEATTQEAAASGGQDATESEASTDAQTAAETGTGTEADVFETEVTGEAASPGQPGMGVAPALVALVAAALLGTRLRE